LPALAADLVQRHVSVLATATTPAVIAAQAVTTTIPIVFETGSDPVRLGLVTNLNRPRGNVTGVTSLIVEVAAKRLELLHELLPTAKVMALLVNPDDRALAQAQAREVLSAARNRKLELQRSDELRIGHFGELPLGRHLCRQGSQRRKSCRIASCAGENVCK
jgi:putative ABC transport system substrate-binding protein